MFKVSAFSFNVCTKTCAPLSDCFINNALIHFVPNCQDTCTQLVNVLDPLLVDLLLHYQPHFVVDQINIRALGGMKSGVSILAAQLSHEPYDMTSSNRILRGNIT